MKKYDKEYSTQYTPEKDYLTKNGVAPTFVKTINEVTTYKYKKDSKLFDILSLFYKQYDNTQEIINGYNKGLDSSKR